MANTTENKTTIGDTEVWENRAFKDWHAPLIPSGSNCINGDCPYVDHFYERNDDDPQTLPLLRKLTDGQRVLIQTDYCGREHVDLVTVREVFDHPYSSRQLRFQEDSRPYYFKPGSTHDSLGYMVFWYSTRYLALTDDKNTPVFGKDGGKAVFSKELARLSGKPLDEVSDQLDALDKKTNKTKTIPFNLRPKGLFSGFCMDQFDTNGPEFPSTLAYIEAFRVPEAVITIASLTQTAERTTRFKTLAPDWKPQNPEALKTRLGELAAWVTENIPNSSQQVNDWQARWHELSL